MVRSNKYFVGCKGETCLWWWQLWRPHLQPVHWAVSTPQTMSDIPSLWAVACDCQWKEKTSREIFLSYPLVPKCVAFYFFFPFIWPKFRTPDHGLQIGRRGKEGSVSTAHPATRAGETLHPPPGQEMPLPPHAPHVHVYLRMCIFSSLPVKRTTEIVNSLPCSPLNSRFFLQSSHCIVA